MLKAENQLEDFVDIVAPMLGNLNQIVFVSPMDVGVVK